MAELGSRGKQTRHDEPAVLRSLDLALEQTAHSHLGHGMGPRLLVPLNLADADIVLAVAGRSESRHGGSGVVDFGFWVEQLSGDR